MTMSEFFSKFGSKYLWLNLFAMALLALVIVAAILLGINSYTNHGETVVVPNLRGMEFDKAEAKMELRGLKLEVSDSGFVRSLAPGTILEQSLKAGVKVKPGRIVYITINTGNTPTIVLPDVADNNSLREAQTKLVAMGFKLGAVEYINGEKDWLYEVKVGGKSISAGSRVPIDAVLVLVVGNGRSSDDGGSYDTISNNMSYPDEDGLGYGEEVIEENILE